MNGLNTTALPVATLHEISDCLTLALDASYRSTGYTQSEREARSYVRAALRQVTKLAGGTVMSTLTKYVSEQQDIALRISGLADALLCLKDYTKDTADAEYAIAAMVQELADKLAFNLDCTSIPEEGAE